MLTRATSCAVRLLKGHPELVHQNVRCVGKVGAIGENQYMNIDRGMFTHGFIQRYVYSWCHTGNPVPPL